MKHVLWNIFDDNIPDALTDRNGDLALAACKICNLAESDLDTTPDCPGCGGKVCSYTPCICAVIHHPQPSIKKAEPGQSVPDILRAAADTYEERNKVYKDNYKRIGAMLEALFPEGVHLRSADDFARWQLFTLKVEKISRLATSGLTHKDSAHDDIVYSAMVQSTITEFTKPIGGIK